MQITIRSYVSILDRSQAIAGGPDLGSIIGIASDPLEFCAITFVAGGYLAYYEKSVTEDLNFDQSMELLGATRVSESPAEYSWEYNGKTLQP